ncbi:MAG: Spy/CpxP family protein refolding chaperone [Opitutaceae bacterium]|jgi:Spy/CpxP family protein refolding chaperone
MKKLLLASLLTAATPLLLAETSPATSSDSFPVIEMFTSHLASKLDLTEAQRAQLKDILRQHQPRIAPLVDSLRTEQKAWFDYSRSATASTDEASDRIDRVLAAQKKLMLETADLRTDLRHVLNDSQLAKLDSLRSEADGHFSKLRKRIQAWLAQV